MNHHDIVEHSLKDQDKDLAIIEGWASMMGKMMR
jgi:hypothetical protein